ncbi:MAG: YkgJ family cysteine cluster protein [Candidatus Bathyarchaeota archaeon]|nr:YkgJ family cysteine cluster protein [Candidatus Bathyarchaeota archaeon]
MSFNYPQCQFECTKCGLCCGDTEQKTRHILLLEAEAEEISQQTSTPKHDFCEPITGKEPYIYEMKKTAGKCIFLKNNQCTVYELRPLICRFYPFEFKFSTDQDCYLFEETLECVGIGKGKLMNRAYFEQLFLLAQQRLG